MAKCKFEKKVEAYSLDGGRTYNLSEYYTKGDLIEGQSQDCAEIQYKWVVVEGEFYCDECGEPI